MYLNTDWKYFVEIFAIVGDEWHPLEEILHTSFPSVEYVNVVKVNLVYDLKLFT